MDSFSHTEQRAARAESKSLAGYAWLIFALLTLCYALVSFYRTSASTLAVDIMRDFAVGGGLMSVMSSAYFYPYGFMQIPAGILADRWGARKTIALFLLLGAGGALMFAHAPSVGIATAGRVFIGLGMGMVFVPALRVILYWFSPARHALATGLLLSFGTGGMLLATYPLMLLSQAIGWRNSMLAAACATVLLSLAAWVWIRDKPSEMGFTTPWMKISRQPSANAIPLRKAMGIIVKSPTYWSVSLWFFSMFGSFYAMTGLWAGPYFIQGCGLDSSSAGAVLFWIAAGAVVGPALIGFLAQWIRISKSLLLAFSCAVTIALMAPLLCAVPVIPSALLPFWGIAFGIFCGGFGSIALTKVQEDFPPEIVGTATGMINIYSYIGTAILQMLSGWIMECLAPGQSAYSAGQYSLMFTMFMGLFCASFVASLVCAFREKRVTAQRV